MSEDNLIKENNKDSNFNQIKPKEIVEEMQESYIDYAMSVIISRALPDIRDGLKPVHRRILYAMNEMGLTHQAKYRKSAAIVGEVMAKYHPHGDSSIYNSLVRMAQDFSLRYPLIQGQGNFGTIDDAPAQMRYTEARLSKIAQTMFSDIKKQTIDFKDNYDGTKKEPMFLPTVIPQLLLNGSLGIAVGMSTNIPPHNLIEVCQALIFLIDHPKATLSDVFQFIKGPDFPDGGIIYNQKEIINAYIQGRGRILIRAKVEIEESFKDKKSKIIIKELPFQTSKSLLIKSFDKLMRENKVQGISSIRDESDKKGLRIVIDVQKNRSCKKILNQLYYLTNLQKFFYLNMLVLVNEKEPKTLSLIEILLLHIKHRQEIVFRRIKFDLQKTKERLHILEGLVIALKNIDKVIAIIKKSSNRNNAKEKLMIEFNLSDIQSEAIVEMKLSSLVKIEAEKLEDELKEKSKTIKELALILNNPSKIDGIIKQELEGLIVAYGDKRRTMVVEEEPGEVNAESFIPDEKTIIVLTKQGYIKRMDLNLYKSQHRGGKGIVGIKTYDNDWVTHFILVHTFDNLLFFTNLGKVFSIPVHHIPKHSRISKGRGLTNFLPIEPEEKILAVLSLNQKDKLKIKYLIMATKNGLVKKTALENFKKIRKSGLIAIKLKSDDALIAVKKINDKDEVMLFTKKGQAIRFQEEQIRPMNRATVGNKGIRLRKDDSIIGIEVINKEKEQSNLLVITENGYGKKTKITEYRSQSRGGVGIKTVKITQKIGHLAKVKILDDDGTLIIISKKGQVIKTSLKNIPVLSRVTQGVKVIQIKPNDQVAQVICV